MFFGQHTIQLNDKKTVSLPKRFAKDIHSNLFITQGFDGNLIIVPEEAFMEIYERASTMNIANPVARLFLRHFLANAAIVDQEKIHEITVSNYLSEYAGFSKEKAAVLVGQGNHIELWGQSKWQEQSQDLLNSQKNVDRFVTLDI